MIKILIVLLTFFIFPFQVVKAQGVESKIILSETSGKPGEVVEINISLVVPDSMVGGQFEVEKSVGIAEFIRIENFLPKSFYFVSWGEIVLFVNMFMTEYPHPYNYQPVMKMFYRINPDAKKGDYVKITLRNSVFGSPDGNRIEHEMIGGTISVK